MHPLALTDEVDRILEYRQAVPGLPWLLAGPLGMLGEPDVTLRMRHQGKNTTRRIANPGDIAH